MLAFLISQLTGLAAKILIASSFSAGMELDAFYAANRPSETLVTIMAGGILVSSFIPVFIKFLVKEDRPSAWKLASATANLILLITSLLAGLTALFAAPVVHYVLGAGFSPEKQALAISLLRIQTISIVFFSLSGVVVGILNSHQNFMASALAPAMYQLGQIFGVLVLAPGMGIFGLAWGVVIGSILNLFIQVPALLRLKGSYFPTLGLHNSSVGDVFRLMAPRMFGAAVVQLMLWVNTLLASHMSPASVFGLSSGFSLMIMAQAVIAQSVATAAMPTFSALFANSRLEDLRKTFASALRGVILLSVPATAGLILLGVPLITFLYQRGEFTRETTLIVAWALTWYAVGLVFHSALEVVVRAYYAMHDTRTPVLVGVAAMSTSIALSLLFSSLFQNAGWRPLGGLALAVSVSTALEVSVLLIILRKRLHGLQGGHLARGAGAAVLGTLVMSLALWGWTTITRSQPAALITLGGVAAGGLIYGLFMLLIRLPELNQLLEMVLRRIQHRQS